MAAKARAKFIRMSPRKVRLVVNLVRGLEITEARKQLALSTKSVAQPVLKALNSAVANAENNDGLNTEGYVVTQAFVDEGPKFYRYTPRAQGRATPIRKRTSHITIEVGPKDGSQPVKVEKKSEKPAEKVAEKKPAKKAAAKKAAPKAKKETKKASNE